MYSGICGQTTEKFPMWKSDIYKLKNTSQQQQQPEEHHQIDENHFSEPSNNSDDLTQAQANCFWTNYPLVAKIYQDQELPLNIVSATYAYKDHKSKGEHPEVNNCGQEQSTEPDNNKVENHSSQPSDNSDDF